jgi:hypothetical protein
MASMPCGTVLGQIRARVYAHPQMASVGMPEKAATGQGPTVRFLLHGNGKVRGLGEPDGLVKCVSDAPDRLIGAPPIWGSNLGFDLLIQDMGEMKDTVDIIAHWLGGVEHS